MEDKESEVVLLKVREEEKGGDVNTK